MTEATQQEQQREQQREQSPYTQFRDSFPLGEDSHNDPKMAVHWRDADRWRQTLRDQIADISSDPELSDEGEQSRMEATYSRLAPRIEQESKAAKQKAAKLAADAERRSIPVAFDAKAGDPQVHGNILAEAQEIRERVARIKEQTPKGMKAPGRVLDMLREEYAEATETGGLAGYTTCQAVLRAAKVLGISAEEVYGSLRTDAHMQALEEAQRYRMAEQAIPTKVPSLDRGKVGGGHHWKKGGSSRLAIPKGGSIAGGGGKKRKPSWK